MGSEIKLSGEEARAITHDDLDPLDDFKVEHCGEWEQDGKYQYKETVFFNKEDKKFYNLCVGRSGSPFTDWHYDWEDEYIFTCKEVAPVKVTKIEWRAV